MTSTSGTARQVSTRPEPAAGPGRARPARPARASCGPRATTPPADQARLLTAVLQDYPGWSVFWDKQHHLWRAAEDDPDSQLYAESSDVQAIISYITGRT